MLLMHKQNLMKKQNFFIVKSETFKKQFKASKFLADNKIKSFDILTLFFVGNISGFHLRLNDRDDFDAMKPFRHIFVILVVVSYASQSKNTAMKNEQEFLFVAFNTFCQPLVRWLKPSPVRHPHLSM